MWPTTWLCFGSLEGKEDEDETETIIVSADDADGDDLTYSCSQGQNITCTPDPNNTNCCIFEILRKIDSRRPTGNGGSGGVGVGAL